MNWQWTPFDALSAADLYAVLRLRQEVFVVEQRCAYLDADGRDDVAMHLCGRDGEALVAYLRAFGPADDGFVHIGRVIVAHPYRGHGLGHELMTRGADLAMARWGPHRVHLSAQAHLRPFYERLGYAVVGPGYLEDDIPHLPMRCPPPRSGGGPGPGRV